jgi:5-formyltetrahydrofolate cyclo-ligase
MEASKVTRFPGAQGRIPNFKGASQAAELVRQLPVWKEALVLKCNPDSPQRYLRLRALEEGKLIYMAIPRLREERCFLELEAERIRGSLEYASSIRGAFAAGRKVTLEEMRPVDLIVCGSVAVTREGGRLGKGGGFSDLEYALAVQAERVGPSTPILSTVHPLQVLEEEIPRVAHDIPVDYVATPEEIIICSGDLPRPEGIYWDLLTEEKIGQVPILRKLRGGS